MSAPTLNINFDPNESRANYIYVVGWLFTGLAIMAVAMKLIGRVITGFKKTGWDDFLIIFAMILSIIATSLWTVATTMGLGRHTIPVLQQYGMERIVEISKLQIIGAAFHVGAFSFPNVSIAILLVRLLPPNEIRAGFFYTMTILQVVIAMINVFTLFFRCTPRKKVWDPSVEGTCWPHHIDAGYTYFVSAYTAFTEVVLALVPIFYVWKLHIHRTAKIGVCIMMGLTMFSAIATIMKVIYIHLFGNLTDPLFIMATLVMWGQIEQNVVIIAACAPTLRPFFRKLFKGSSSSSTFQRSAVQSEFSVNIPSLPHFISSEQDSPIHQERKRSDDEESNESQQETLYHRNHES